MVITMFHTINLKNLILCILIFSVSVFIIIYSENSASPVNATKDSRAISEVEFNASSEALMEAMRTDIKTENDDYPISWTDIIAYLACLYDNDFSLFTADDIKRFEKEINNGKTIEEICDKFRYFDLYKSFYDDVLCGFVGDYTINDAEGKPVHKYGLKAFSPIGAPYSYNSFDDFGALRTYGYKRVHLGCDLIGAEGTPIIAVEEGIIENIGWNEYGGWRIGIRSPDKKRYFYYAHLMKDTPYASDFKVGDSIDAGTLIGYMGKTGYSKEENAEGIETPHLHFGMQLSSFKDEKGDGVWIDMFEITKFLLNNRMNVTDYIGSDTRKADKV